ncbi:hypothetical protein QQM79_14795 [Marinobacteraceae bacterium S3BR75-40.1]
MTAQEQPPGLALDWVTPDGRQLPTASVRRTMVQSLEDLWRRLVAQSEPHDRAREDALAPLNPETLGRIAGAPSWGALARSLEQKLREWGRNAVDVVSWVVAPPFSGAEQALELLAHSGYRVIVPPTEEQILAGDRHWLDQFWEGDSPWVVPELSRCFLRCPEGLALLSELIPQAMAGQLGPGVLGCQAWGWSFLQALFPQLRPPVLTPQALDAAVLARWLGALAADEQGPHSFYQTDTGQPVLTWGRQDTSSFLRDLAAHARGNAGVALALWREALRDEPEDQDAAQQARQSARALWVVPWTQLQAPVVAPERDRERDFVLHALITHGALSWQGLVRTTGLSLDVLQLTVPTLLRRSVVAQEEDRFRIQVAVYPSVRRHLIDEGFAHDSVMN